LCAKKAELYCIWLLYFEV